MDQSKKKTAVRKTAPKKKKTSIDEFLKKDDKAKKHQRQSAFVNLRSLMGNTWAKYYVCIGAAQSGKTYAASKIGIHMKKRLGDKCKWYWLRLTETSARKLLQDNGVKLIDADLVRKYGLKLKTKGNNVYDENDKSYTSPLVTVLPLSTVYSDKGSSYFDKDFDGDYFIIFDEMNRDTYAGEKVTFDITYNLKRQLENLLRNTGSKQSKAHSAKVLMLGNTMSEASDVMLSFNFVPNPGQFGRYKLRNKKLVMDYLPLTKEYIRMREGSVVDMITTQNESGFTNTVEADLTQIDPKPTSKPQVIIKFTDDKSTWYTIWDRGVIKKWNGEQIHATIAMRRYLQGETYNNETVRSVYEMFDNKSFRYKNYYTQVSFRHELEKLKPQRS